MDRLECLHAFIRVMESGSFSTAAKELGLGQPAVSKRIALLEQDFESQLFLRSTRKLRPTPEAHVIYDQARQIVDTYEATRATVKRSAPRPAGTLRISVPSSFGRKYMMPLIAEYSGNHPDVTLDVKFSERFVDLVEDGIELALRIGDLKSSALVARRLGFIRRYVVASAAYLQHHISPKSPDDLVNHNCIQYSGIAPANKWAFESEFGRHVVEISGSLLVDDADAMLEAVLENQGIAILPVWLVLEEIHKGRLTHLLPNYSIPSLPLNALYLDTNWMSIRARTFLDFLISHTETFNQELLSDEG